LKFVKRDLILLAGSVLFVIGLAPFMAPIFAIASGTAIFFGIKYAVTRNQKILEKEVGEGICAECGAKILNNKCPYCG